MSPSASRSLASRSLASRSLASRSLASRSLASPALASGVREWPVRPGIGVEQARRSAMDLLLLAGFALLAFQMLGPVLSIPLHIPLNYNEGWNAVLDSRAVMPGAGPLYPGPDSFVFNNYPPLGFYIVGGLGRFVFGDMILAGRIVALFSLLGSAALVGFCVRCFGGRLRGAIAAGLLMLLFVNSYFKIYVAVDDPQWLAHALMLGGLAVLLCRGGLARLQAGDLPSGQIVVAALLVVAGGLVKHNLVALPLATALWLLSVNRRAAAVWVLTAMAGLGAALGVIAALHGQAAFADVLHHRRVFRVNLAKQSIKGLAPLIPLALAGLALLRRAWRRDPLARPAILFVALFAGIAFVTGVVQRMGEGVYYNAHFETLIALCLGFGLAVSSLATTPARWGRLAVGPLVACVFAAAPLIGAWPWHLPRAWHDIADRHARAAAWQPMIDRIAAVHGPAGCLMSSLCWWAGKASEVDMFNLTEKSIRSGGPLPAFRAAVAEQRFAIFQEDPASFIHRDAVHRLGFDPILPLFNRYYAPVFFGPGGLDAVKGTVLLMPVRAGSRNTGKGITPN